MRRLLVTLAGSVLLSGTSFAQVVVVEPTPVAPAPEAAPAAQAPGEVEQQSPFDYRIGAGDILEIDVFGNDDLSRTATVQTNGTITLPLLGEVPVVGQTEREAATHLTELLAKDYLVNPQVEVRIKEYRSQFVSVVGEVQSPGRKALKGRTRLIDAMVEAGGLNTRASGEIIVTRINGTFPDGATALTVHLGGTLTPENQRLIETLLVSGDMITASTRQYVTVEGEVQRPGRYPIEGELTVSGAVSTAGGLTRFGGSDVRIRRVNPATGQTQILEANLKAIRKGKQPDTTLLPNDFVSVARRLF
jgi:polysaccharide export outer membrane protein